MASNLIQRLRTCSAEERRAVAMQLAQTGTDEGITELVRVVEGRRRSGLSWYNLDDQLMGIEALGETKSEKAWKYLLKLSSYSVDAPHERWEKTSDYDEKGKLHYRMTFKAYDGVIYFPNAFGKLRELLVATYLIRVCLAPDPEKIKDKPTSPEQALSKNEPYQKIISSIQKLAEYLNR